MGIDGEISQLDYIKKTPREVVSLFGYWMPNGSTVDREKFTYDKDKVLIEDDREIVKGFGSELLEGEMGFRLSWISERSGKTEVEGFVVDGDFEISTEERNPWTKSIVLKQKGVNEERKEMTIIRRFTQKR